MYKLTCNGNQSVACEPNGAFGAMPPPPPDA